MRHVRNVLRLRTAGISGNEIARRLNLAPSTVRLTLQRAAAARLVWPQPAELTDAALEARLFTAVGTKHQARTPPPFRTRLGRGSPRAEAQARHAADPVGRVYPRGLPTPPDTYPTASQGQNRPIVPDLINWRLMVDCVGAASARQCSRTASAGDSTPRRTALGWAAPEVGVGTRAAGPGRYRDALNLFGSRSWPRWGRYGNL